MKTSCPCHSSKHYKSCCEPFHKGLKKPSTAVQLLRSRYSAYAMHLPDYIIATTHPSSPHYERDQGLWRQSILEFSNQTNFDGLEVLELQDGLGESTATFIAKLSKEGKDVSFKEKSLFKKVNGAWTFYSGEH